MEAEGQLPIHSLVELERKQRASSSAEENPMESSLKVKARNTPPLPHWMGQQHVQGDAKSSAVEPEGLHSQLSPAKATWP